MNNILLIIVVIIGLVFFSALLAKLKINNGKRAEKKLDQFLKRNLDKKDWHIISNITLPIEQGKGTTQIDTIIISIYGIFVIEVKEYSGKIYTNSGKTWYQYLGKKKYPFQNPHYQNILHINALSTIFRLPKNCFKNLVIFLGTAEFKSIPENTFTSLESLISALKAKEAIIPRARIIDLIGRVEYFRKYDLPETDSAHIEYVQKKLKATTKHK